DPALLIRASQALRGVELLCAPFDVALQRTSPGDFVYLDPPYDPLSETASFTSYTPDPFQWEDQKRLAAACAALDGRGVRFLLSIRSRSSAIGPCFSSFSSANSYKAPRPGVTSTEPSTTGAETSRCSACAAATSTLRSGYPSA